MRRTLTLWAAGLLGGMAAFVYAGTGLENTLESWIQEALRNNPGLIALREEAASLGEKAVYSGTLPDPVVRLGLMNLPVNNFAFDQEPMTGKQVMVIQRFPFFGTLGLKSRIAGFEKAMADARIRSQERMVVQEVRETAADLAAIGETRRILRWNGDLLARWEKAAEQKYTTGKGMQSDVLRARLAGARLRERESEWKRKQAVSENRLNTLLGRPPGTDLPFADTLLWEPAALSRDTLFRRIDRENPDLEEAKIRVSMAKAQRGLASRSWTPNLEISLAYTQRDDFGGRTLHDFFSVQAGMNLPLWFWRNQKPRIREAGIRIRGMEAGLEKLRNDLHRKAADFLEALNDTEARLRLYDTEILPLNRQTLDASLIAYQVDRMDFVTLLEFQRRLLDDQMNRARLAADHEKIRAQLDGLTGGWKSPAGSEGREPGRGNHD